MPIQPVRLYRGDTISEVQRNNHNAQLGEQQTKPSQKRSMTSTSEHPHFTYLQLKKSITFNFFHAGTPKQFALRRIYLSSNRSAFCWSWSVALSRSSRLLKFSTVKPPRPWLVSGRDLPSPSFGVEVLLGIGGLDCSHQNSDFLFPSKRRRSSRLIGAPCLKRSM